MYLDVIAYRISTVQTFIYICYSPVISIHSTFFEYNSVPSTLLDVVDTILNVIAPVFTLMGFTF